MSTSIMLAMMGTHVQLPSRSSSQDFHPSLHRNAVETNRIQMQMCVEMLAECASKQGNGIMGVGNEDQW